MTDPPRAAVPDYGREELAKRRYPLWLTIILLVPAVIGWLLLLYEFVWKQSA